MCPPPARRTPGLTSAALTGLTPTQTSSGRGLAGQQEPGGLPSAPRNLMFVFRAEPPEDVPFLLVPRFAGIGEGRT